MRPFSQLWSSSMGKLDYNRVTVSDEDESLTFEEQSFLPGKAMLHSQQKSSITDVIRTSLTLLLLASGVGLILTMGIKQIFPGAMDSHESMCESNAIINSASDVIVDACGSSPEEARAAGCVFDNIAFAWVPPRCWDEDLSKSFRDMKFNFSLTPNFGDPIPQDAAYTGDYPHLYVNWEYHLLHCTWMWRKMHRAVLGKGRAAVDGIAKDTQHTSHCETMLLWRQEVPYDSMNTLVSVKYPECGA